MVLEQAIQHIQTREIPLVREQLGSLPFLLMVIFFRTCNVSNIPIDLLRQAKQYGFSDRQLGGCIGATELAVRRLRQEARITPF